MILGDTIDEGSYGPIQVGVVVKMKRNLGGGYCLGEVVKRNEERKGLEMKRKSIYRVLDL